MEECESQSTQNVSEAAAPPLSSDDIPEVCIIAKQLPEAATSAVSAMIARNDPPQLFMHNGQLVRLPRQGQTGPEISLLPMGIADLQEELAYAARWSEMTERGTKAIYPPSLVARDVLHRAADWAPSLREVVRVPIFGENWALLDGPGYQAHDHIFFQPNHGPLPSVPQVPSETELAEARRLICEEMLGDFPFLSSSDRAAAIAPMILPFVRHRIEGPTPLHLFDSPQPGSGKTLLADVISIPAIGKEPAANTEISNADDLRKWVTAMALAGEGVVLIDNINARLKGSALAGVLTSAEWSDRIVGTSRRAKVAMRCVWLATGNNVVMSSELARRVVRCRIDSGVERPHLRGGFRHAHLRAWVKAHRAQLIWAVLVMVRNWIAHGNPGGEAILGSFEAYCCTMGGILDAAGIEGFLQDGGPCHADDKSLEWSAFVEAWHRRFEGKHIGAADLDAEILEPNPEMLATVLAGASSQRGRRIKLGQELRKRRDAIVSGHRISTSDGVDGHGCWSYWLG
jgi:hypothetical protein